MKRTKTFLVTGAIAGLGVMGAGVQAASAHIMGGTDLAATIAEKFNLSQDEVQAVLDEERDLRQAEIDADYSEKLQEQVDAGEITAEQKILIEEKRVELQTERQANRDSLQAWADENSVDLKYVAIQGSRGESDLEDAVADGEITAEQKILIEEKLAELEASQSEVKASLEAWAEEHDIDLKDVMFGAGRGHGGPKRGGMQGGN